MNYSVVIPSNVASKLRNCVHSILEHTSLPPGKIVVVDDGARAGWDSEDPAVTWIKGVEPFVYSRNVNLGIAAAGQDDVVVIGDDVRVLTAGGFDLLAESASDNHVFAVSAAIDGTVGNPYQRRRSSGAVRDLAARRLFDGVLCFVCIFLPRRAIDEVGPLDERFVYYGGEDVDWSWRARALGGRLLVDDRCVVSHNDQDMPSAFRSQSDHRTQLHKTIDLLREKWPERFQ